MIRVTISTSKGYLLVSSRVNKVSLSLLIRFRRLFLYLTYLSLPYIVAMYRRSESSNFRGSRMCFEGLAFVARVTKRTLTWPRGSHECHDPAGWRTCSMIRRRFAQSSYAKIANTREIYVRTWGRPIVGTSNRWSRNQVFHWWNY